MKRPKGVAPDRKVNACPECDGTRLAHRPGGFVQMNKETRWKCRDSDCGARFDKPNRRLPKSPTKPKGLAGRLADANPEDVGL